MEGRNIGSSFFIIGPFGLCFVTYDVLADVRVIATPNPACDAEFVNFLFAFLLSRAFFFHLMA